MHRSHPIRCLRRFSTTIHSDLAGLLDDSNLQSFLNKISDSSKLLIGHPRVGRPATGTTAAARPSGVSSVLVPLVEVDDKPWLVTTHRSYTLRAHRGEICFPGGKIEPEESIEKAALREAHEEINLDPDSVKVLGHLRHTLTRKLDAKVHPVFGIVQQKHLVDLKSIIEEFQAIYLIPIHELYQSRHYTNFRYSKIKYRLPVFFSSEFKILSKTENAYVDPQHHLRIWGLSAVMLNQLLVNLLPEAVYPRDPKLPY